MQKGSRKKAVTVLPTAKLVCSCGRPIEFEYDVDRETGTECLVFLVTTIFCKCGDQVSKRDLLRCSENDYDQRTGEARTERAIDEYENRRNELEDVWKSKDISA